jgi:hypothetical protein
MKSDIDNREIIQGFFGDRQRKISHNSGRVVGVAAEIRTGPYKCE